VLSRRLFLRIFVIVVGTSSSPPLSFPLPVLRFLLPPPLPQ
jgi:hypothetical protein